MKTLEEYLRNEIAQGHIQHSIVARKTKEGKVIFYIHADGFDSETMDFIVSGNELEYVGLNIPE